MGGWGEVGKTESGETVESLPEAGARDFLLVQPPEVPLASALQAFPLCARHAGPGHSPQPLAHSLRNICHSTYHINRLALRIGQVFSTQARKHQNRIAFQAFQHWQSSWNDSHGLTDNKTHIAFALRCRWGYLVLCGGETKTCCIWESGN